MLVQDDRDPLGVAEAAIGETNTVGLYELGRRGLVRMTGHLTYPLLLHPCPAGMRCGSGFRTMRPESVVSVCRGEQEFTYAPCLGKRLCKPSGMPAKHGKWTRSQLEEAKSEPVELGQHPAAHAHEAGRGHYADRAVKRRSAGEAVAEHRQAADGPGFGRLVLQLGRVPNYRYATESKMQHRKADRPSGPRSGFRRGRFFDS
jgi:hypothetical protein